MLCEKYKDTLIETAANGGALPKSLREHVETCAQCGATLAAQQALFTAVDSSLHGRANSRCRASLGSRLETALNEQPASQRSVVPGWAVASAAAVLACIVFGTQVFRQHLRAPQAAMKAEATLERATLGRVKPAISALERSPIVRGAAKPYPRNTQLALRVVSEPEVLVPPDEREAFAKFVAGLQQREDVAQALLHPAPKTEEELFPMESIQIAQLEIKPLESQDDPQGSVEK